MKEQFILQIYSTWKEYSSKKLSKSIPKLNQLSSKQQAMIRHHIITLNDKLELAAKTPTTKALGKYKYYLVQDKTSLKFCDGFYGWDSLVDEGCVFGKNELPFEWNEGMNFIPIKTKEFPSKINIIKAANKFR